MLQLARQSAGSVLGYWTSSTGTKESVTPEVGFTTPFVGLLIELFSALAAGLFEKFKGFVKFAKFFV